GSRARSGAPSSSSLAFRKRGVTSELLLDPTRAGPIAWVVAQRGELVCDLRSQARGALAISLDRALRLTRGQLRRNLLCSVVEVPRVDPHEDVGRPAVGRTVGDQCAFGSE